ncbi:hypothetical protein Tco_0370241 [Tanacetum coccineum]
MSSGHHHSVTLTSSSYNSEPGGLFGHADEERQVDYKHNMFSTGRGRRGTYVRTAWAHVHCSSVPEPIYHMSIYHLEVEHVFPAEEQPLPPVDSPTALSSGYVADSDPEEDPEEDSKEEHADYPADRGDDDDDNDDDDDDDYDDDDDDDDDDVDVMT